MASPQVSPGKESLQIPLWLLGHTGIPEDLFTSSISHLSCNITLLKGLQHRSQSWQTKSKNPLSGRGFSHTFVIGQKRSIVLPQILPVGRGHSSRTTPGLGSTWFFLV